ncbi:MAG: hypothetical protein AABX38_07105 [Candidatus Micrarchaeota archaeon]
MKKNLNINIDLNELRNDQKKNFEERLRFIDAYVAWLKRTPNQVWSKQQKKMLD